MVRTTPSPSCCCTSSVNSLPSSVKRIVDLRQLLAREFDVDHRADALDYRSFVHDRFLRSNSNLKTRHYCGRPKFAATSSFNTPRRARQTAAAPATISDSSLVIAAWRRLVVDQLQLVDDRRALSDAAFIATMRALCSDAMFSFDRLIDDRLDVARQQAVEHGLRVRFVDVVPGYARFSASSPRSAIGRIRLATGVCFIVLSKRVATMCNSSILPSMYASSCTLTGPISLSRCGRSPRLIDLRDDVGLEPMHEAQALVADAP